MILSVSSRITNFSPDAPLQKNDGSLKKNLSTPMKLSGYNNPMKSYVSFGWCTAHYQAMYELDEKLMTKLSDKLKLIETLKEEETAKARYSIIDDASLTAASILSQYANMQCVVAEVPPSYALITGGKLKKAMEKTKTLTNPVSILTCINAVNNMTVKNSEVNEPKLKRAKASTQLYTTTILLKQLEENKNKPEYKENAQEIDNLVSIIEKRLKSIYGQDILDRIDRFANMGVKPSDKEKRNALDFLIEIDSKAQDMNLSEDFEENLKQLINKLNLKESKDLTYTEPQCKNICLKLYYPDHEHILGQVHTHQHSHEYMHENGIPHSHEHTHDEKTDFEQLRNNMHHPKHENDSIQIEQNRKIQNRN